MNVICECKGPSPTGHYGGQAFPSLHSTDEPLLHPEKDWGCLKFFANKPKKLYFISAEAEF